MYVKSPGLPWLGRPTSISWSRLGHFLWVVIFLKASDVAWTEAELLQCQLLKVKKQELRCLRLTVSHWSSFTVSSQPIHLQPIHVKTRSGTSCSWMVSDQSTTFFLCPYLHYNDDRRSEGKDSSRSLSLSFLPSFLVVTLSSLDLDLDLLEISPCDCCQNAAHCVNFIPLFLVLII